MNLVDAFHVSQGVSVPGHDIVYGIDDSTRHVTVYRSADGKELSIGFDCTRGIVWPPSQDWLANLDAWPKAFLPFPGVSAFSGFLDEYTSVSRVVMDQVRVYEPLTANVFGFSQGAAHATLCFLELVTRFPGIPVHCVAFASPRVLEGGASSKLSQTLAGANTFRRVNVWGDPVPNLPPWIIGYRHVGTTKYIGPFKLLPDPGVHNGETYLKALEKS